MSEGGHSGESRGIGLHKMPCGCVWDGPHNRVVTCSEHSGAGQVAPFLCTTCGNRHGPENTCDGRARW